MAESVWRIMNQDQKKYFRQRIDAAVQSKILELNLQVQKAEKPELESYLTKKNFKPSIGILINYSIRINYSGEPYFSDLPIKVLFDLTEYNKKVKSVENHNKAIDKTLRAAVNLIRSDADKVIDYLMFADEKEALEQLQEFQKKVYKVQ